MNKYYSIFGRECEITIEPRQSYCDRGNWLAKMHPNTGEFALSLDHQDLWPRYYFDLKVAKSECVAWLKKRGQFVATEQWEGKAYE